MDSKLIDNLLTELLMLPEQYRTPEKILASLTLAATAAGISLSTEGAPLQLEHLKLHAALERLAAEFGDAYIHRATLRLGGGLEGVELCGVIEPRESGLNQLRFVAFGRTAAQVLNRLKSDIAAQAQPPKPKPVIARPRGPLSRLKQRQREWA
ncbi:hypothetical protein MCB86_16750 [Pseudomonas sp. KSR10]|uniref:hypothetical protein n=1 Tax=Pseudomonas sp. KSR10 TaxID=2916654 RepID=UPI001EF97FAA|nr:hypothetical protein [Pseudomonas sp. KSR10]MCG6541724.1 hypothetical protein [Pseudomonas sp. KSR10]